MPPKTFPVQGVKKVKIFADYHTHSHYSDGRASILEIAQAAKVQGLEKIAITDHGPRNLGTGVRGADQFLKIKEETRQVAEQLEGLEVLCGAEANIIDLEGGIDIPEKVCQELDLLLVGLHPFILPENLATAWEYVAKNCLQKHVTSLREKVKNTNTKTLVEAMYKHDVAIITHPGLQMPLDLDEVARACAATDTAYEINVGHDYQEVVEIAQVARHGVKFVVNSDAHFPESVGKLEKGLNLLEQAKVPPEQVLNARV